MGLCWVVISKQDIIGPFWFEEQNQHLVTVNTERYLGILGKFWTALANRRGVMRALHTSNVSLKLLWECFGDRLISRKCDSE